MSQKTATFAYILGIVGLFYMDRSDKERTSKALWIPVIWLMIVGSRPISMWFETGPTISQGDVGTEGSPIDAAVYGILAIIGAGVIGSRWPRVKSVLRGNLPLLLYFSYCVLSIIWSDYSFVALKRCIKAVTDFAMIAIVLTDPNPGLAIKRYFSRVGFILLPLSLLFIKYYPDIGRAYDPWTWEPLYCGVTTFKNLLGMICLVCALGALWSFIGAYERRKMPRRAQHLAAHGIIVAVAIWLFLTADSMTSLTCFLMGGAVMVMTTRRWVVKRESAVHALVACCVLMSLFALFGDSGGTLVGSLGRNPTLTGRTAIWQAVLSLHTNPLFGAGFESFWLGSRMERVWEITKQHIQEAHDGYLEVYLNLGLVGIALLVTMIVSGYRNVLAVYRRDTHAGRIRLAFFTAGVIYSVTEAGFRMMSPIWLGFLLAITRVSSNSLEKKSGRRSELAPAAVVPEARTEVAIQEFI
jgi:exopolysaccharide production protein ExoQ